MELKSKKEFGDFLFRMENNEIGKYIITEVSFSKDIETNEIVETYVVKHAKYHRHERVKLNEIGTFWFESPESLFDNILKNLDDGL